ncbi:16S rRNA (uracil(1498)-N(3))-methyltransferase [Aliamphritea ceti]|uniref:16S rRNA (uracil(1498)-N(3))-methyltransferase n=1 Tax=Aliamphritea ceti TaxID=1524258 RepID=UPI0021C3EF37|nr:16S rRNA (uracil(1498)-N(3))-methyltransferase [Aliamphritea ceti]
MNLILLTEADFDTDNIATLSDRRFQHIHTVHKAQVGDTLKVGKLNGELGIAEVTAISGISVTLRTNCTQSPPDALPLTIVLALPRPKMLKRTLQSITSMGVKQIYLINAYKVDKSYWSSPVLDAESLQEQLMLGLEQCIDTQLPEIHLRKRFKPFVEDELPAIAAHTRALVAHPYNAASCPCAENTPTTLAVGPEGGFIQYEVDKLNEAGLTPMHIGPRILRVENAVPVLLARLFPI